MPQQHAFGQSTGGMKEVEAFWRAHWDYLSAAYAANSATESCLLSLVEPTNLRLRRNCLSVFKSSLGQPTRGLWSDLSNKVVHVEPGV